MLLRPILRSNVMEFFDGKTLDCADALKFDTTRGKAGEGVEELSDMVTGLEDMPSKDAERLLPLCEDVAKTYGIDAGNVSFLTYIPQSDLPVRKTGVMLYSKYEPLHPKDRKVSDILFGVPGFAEYVPPNGHRRIMRGYFAGMLGSLWREMECERARMELDASENSIYFLSNAKWMRDVEKVNGSMELSEIASIYGMDREFFDFISYTPYFRSR
jgi:hypothetical protein